ncbi:unnamed protein product, partial [Protopolystoma xenopodis]
RVPLPSVQAISIATFAPRRPHYPPFSPANYAPLDGCSSNLAKVEKLTDVRVLDGFLFRSTPTNDFNIAILGSGLLVNPTSPTPLQS